MILFFSFLFWHLLGDIQFISDPAINYLCDLEHIA